MFRLSHFYQPIIHGDTPPSHPTEGCFSTHIAVTPPRFRVMSSAQSKNCSNMKALGIQPEAWGPLAEGSHGIFPHPLLTDIGSNAGRTTETASAFLCSWQ